MRLHSYRDESHSRHFDLIGGEGHPWSNDLVYGTAADAAMRRRERQTQRTDDTASSASPRRDAWVSVRRTGKKSRSKTIRPGVAASICCPHRCPIAKFLYKSLILLPVTSRRQR
jgi:hypothetical protein